MQENEDTEPMFLPPPSEALSELARAMHRIQQRFYAAVSPLYYATYSKIYCVFCGKELDDSGDCDCKQKRKP